MLQCIFDIKTHSLKTKLIQIYSQLEDTENSVSKILFPQIFSSFLIHLSFILQDLPSWSLQLEKWLWVPRRDQVEEQFHLKASEKGVSFFKKVSMSNVQDSAAMFSFMIFMVLDLTFKSLIHFEFILVCGIRRWSCLIFLHVSVQFSQYHLLSKLSLAHGMSLLPLSNINWLWRCGFISGLSILFHWSICLFVCQYHAVLITKAL